MPIPPPLPHTCPRQLYEARELAQQRRIIRKLYSQDAVYQNNVGLSCTGLQEEEWQGLQD